MRPIVTDGWSSVVCPSVGLSVGLSVCHDREPSKSGLTDRDAVWVVDSCGPKKHVVDRVQIRPCEGTIWRGNEAANCKTYGLSAVSCAKTV